HATGAVRWKNLDRSPAPESEETRAELELVPALALGEPIETDWLSGIASRAWSLKLPPLQATAATRGRAISLRMSFISLAGDGPLFCPSGHSRAGRMETPPE